MTFDCCARGPAGRGAKPEQAALAAAGAQVAAARRHRLPRQHHGRARSAAAGRGAHPTLLLGLPQTRAAVPQPQVPLMMQHVHYKGGPRTWHRPELTVLHARHLWEARVGSLLAKAWTADVVQFFSRHAKVAPRPF